MAVIPARGGSKRIPRKNIRPFFGQPVIGYSIRAAQAAGMFSRIIVSTDDDEIAAVARAFGAEVPFRRPANLSDDTARTNPVVKHALEWLRENGYKPMYACCIYATAPFVQAEDLRDAFRRLKEAGWEYVFSATNLGVPIQRSLRLLPDQSVEPVAPEHILVRSQDLEPVYHDAGQFYWGKASAFLDDLPVFARHSTVHLIPRYRVQDIDTPEDWRRAELMYGALQSHHAPGSEVEKS